MRFPVLQALVLICAAALSSTDAQQVARAEPAATTAEEVVSAFVEKACRGDAQGLTAISDVPYYPDSAGVLKATDQLNQFYTGIVGKISKDAGGKVLKHSTELAPDAPKLDSGMFGEHQVVRMTLQEGRFKGDVLQFYVKMSKAGPKIIGLCSTPRPMHTGPPRERSVREDLQQIMLGIQNFDSARRYFPPQAICDLNGKPLLSWRVRILPYIEGKPLYDAMKLDEPWDSPHNKQFIESMLPVFAVGRGKDDGKTCVMVFAGKETPFDGGKKTRGIRDGKATTINFVLAGPDKAVPWTKPEDLPFVPSDPKSVLGTIPGDKIHVVFCNGVIEAIPKNVPSETFKAMITHEGGEKIDLESVLSGATGGPPPSTAPGQPEAAKPEPIKPPRYKILAHQAVGSTRISAKVLVEAAGNQAPNEAQLKAIWTDLNGKTPKIVSLSFYVLGMDPKKPAWATAVPTGKSAVKIKMFLDRVPKNYRPPQSTPPQGASPPAGPTGPPGQRSILSAETM